jgi:hypothetical protein
MTHYLITIRRINAPDFRYDAIGTNCIDVMLAAYDTYGACGVTVKAIK